MRASGTGSTMSQNIAAVDADARAAELAWLHRIPKVELHVHLEGAIPHHALWQLIQKYGGDPAVPDRDTLREKFQYRGFSDFIETWIWKNGFLREYEDFTFIADETAHAFERQNIRYAEVFFSPSDFARHGLSPQGIAAAIRQGFSEVPSIEVSLVADLVRDSGPRQAAHTLEMVYDVKDLGVVGIGIGGSEQQFPPEPFADIFERARTLGFRTSAHAGEAAGPESIWGSVKELRVDRVGHATRATEDMYLVDHLTEHGIPLELCMTSNLRTGVIRFIEDHPVREFWDRGMVLSVNTDDPQMFGITLAEELMTLRVSFGFSREEIRHLQLLTLQASWAPAVKKRSLRRALLDCPT